MKKIMFNIHDKNWTLGSKYELNDINLNKINY